MFAVDKEILQNIKNLDDNANFIMISKWISELADNNIQAVIHSWPDPADTAYRDKLGFQRGMAAALDTLRNILSNPDRLIEESKNIEQIQAASEEILTV